MQKTTKGALAAAAAVLLSLGGTGTMATWVGSQTITGGTVKSGSLVLAGVGCGDWSLDTAGGLPATYSPGDLLVPGDVLTKQCSFTVTATGSHMKADVALTTPSFSGAGADFLGKLTANVSGVTLNGQAFNLGSSQITSADNGKTLAATIQVAFSSTAGNLTQGLTTVLDDLTLTATQTHA